MNYQISRRAGLLHDIGKAIDKETEGPHALIGADILRKFGENEEIIHAVASHHYDVPLENLLTISFKHQMRYLLHDLELEMNLLNNI